jgi:hypothetical protein
MTIRTRASGNMLHNSVVFLKMPLYLVSNDRSGFLGGCMDLFVVLMMTRVLARKMKLKRDR